MNKITGFLLDVDEDKLTIQVTIPANYGTIVMDSKGVWSSDDTIWPDDIPVLIDLSLAMRDRNWFDKWRYELSLWRPVDQFFHQPSKS